MINDFLPMRGVIENIACLYDFIQCQGIKSMRDNQECTVANMVIDFEETRKLWLSNFDFAFQHDSLTHA